MPTSKIELFLEYPDGHTGTVVAALAEHGWDVHAELGNDVVVDQHCDDWHRVERVRARIQTQIDLAVIPIASSPQVKTGDEEDA